METEYSKQFGVVQPTDLPKNEANKGKAKKKKQEKAKPTSVSLGKILKAAGLE